MFLSLRYRILLILLLMTLLSLGAFYFSNSRMLGQDKWLSVMDLNLAELGATSERINTYVRGRLALAQLIAQGESSAGPADISDPYPGNDGGLISVQVYRIRANQISVAEKALNRAYLDRFGLPESEFRQEQRRLGEALDAIVRSGPVAPRLRQRSFTFQRKAAPPVILPLVTVVVKAETYSPDAMTYLVADFAEGPIRRELGKSSVGEMFLISGTEGIISRSRGDIGSRSIASGMAGPILERMRRRGPVAEFSEVEADGEPYLVGLAPVGFADMFVGSSVRKELAFAPLRRIIKKSLGQLLAIFYIGAVLSLFFSRRLTSRLQKLSWAADQIAEGNFKVRVPIQSRDEIGNVSGQFNQMAERLTTLMDEVKDKARLEAEMKTANIVQSTILAPTKVRSPLVETEALYRPATEIGGDFWDAHVQDGILTLVLGDATGHGVGAAIVTAVAKTCFIVLMKLYGSKMTVEQFLKALNQMIFRSCSGKLLMTMCAMRLDLRSGELTLCSAGHEAPMLIRGNDRPTSLFARGERLGFSPETSYQTITTQMEIGDTLLIYTDGLVEAKNPKGSEWSERRLRKSLTGMSSRPLTEIKNGVMSQVNEHLKGASPDDDITFVLLRWKQMLA